MDEDEEYEEYEETGQQNPPIPWTWKLIPSVACDLTGHLFSAAADALTAIAGAAHTLGYGVACDMTHSIGQRQFADITRAELEAIHTTED